MDAKILRKVRTEYGKKIRKEYESHTIYEKRANMTEYEPRTDGIANSLTKVTKDNLLLVGIRQATQKGYIECRAGGVFDGSYPTSELRRGRVQGGGDISPTLTAQSMGICRIERNEEMENNAIIEEQPRYRIRKLTEKECWRLMGFTDEDFYKAAARNSRSQLYKQAGNSIVTTCLMAIFSQLLIEGCQVWNEMSEERRNELIDRTRVDFTPIVQSDELLDEDDEDGTDGLLDGEESEEW